MWTSAGRALLALAICPLLAVAPATALAQPDATAQAKALFDDYWQWVLREYPEFATLVVGDHRYDDKLRDHSRAAVIARRSALAAFRERSGRISAQALSTEDRVSLRILQHRLDATLAVEANYGGLPFAAFDPWAPVTQLFGLHMDLGELATSGRFQTVADYEAWLKRLNAVPTALLQLTDRMELAMTAGWMPPRIAIERVPGQLDAHLVDDVQHSPAYAPFRSFPPDIAPAERSRLAKDGEQVIRSRVAPAVRSFKRFYETRYMPAAAEHTGMSALPGGLPYYQAWLTWHTTTGMTPRQVHDLGISEVQRIGRQMDAIVKASSFKGTRSEFQQYLSSDPQFFFDRAEDMLSAYRDIAKRADAALPALFAELPRLPYGVRAMRPDEGDNPERYTSGSPENGRPGWFEANVNDLKSRPKWAMESLVLHEAVPGHHLQTARAQELKQLPDFRRYGWIVAYTEGWALYAESLGDEMGLYKDPAQKFGSLSAEMLRACRLVVDTGLHAFGWNRARAIDYMVANTGLTRAEITAEVDRYLVWPGQATGYKVGELKFRELRARAKARLGDRFDLRRFHNVLIDHGAVPLSVLEQTVDEWIAAELARTLAGNAPSQ